MAKHISFTKRGKVSLWLAARKPNAKAMQDLDILKDLCGVDEYDLDSQELAAISDDFRRASVADLLSELSYSSSFVTAALQAAEESRFGMHIGR